MRLVEIPRWFGTDTHSFARSNTGVLQTSDDAWCLVKMCVGLESWPFYFPKSKEVMQQATSASKTTSPKLKEFEFGQGMCGKGRSDVGYCETALLKKLKSQYACQLFEDVCFYPGYP